jgi:YspA, cpYpsA-related SLOG family
MRVVVSGSRGWGGHSHVEVSRVYKRLEELPRGTVILHGDASRGADRIADKAAKTLRLKVERHPAPWQMLGKRAGIVRNIEMLDTKPDLVIAFWDGESRGTGHMIHAARERGIPIEVITR